MAKGLAEGLAEDSSRELKGLLRIGDRPANVLAEAG